MIYKAPKSQKKSGRISNNKQLKISLHCVRFVSLRQSLLEVGSILLLQNVGLESVTNKLNKLIITISIFVMLLSTNGLLLDYPVW